jgi:hypothetical protein
VVIGGAMAVGTAALVDWIGTGSGFGSVRVIGVGAISICGTGAELLCLLIFVIARLASSIRKLVKLPTALAAVTHVLCIKLMGLYIIVYARNRTIVLIVLGRV